MAESSLIDVEVAYARPDIQVVLPVQVTEGTTLMEAINQSGVLEKFPEIDLAQNRVGIFGKISKPDTVLRPRDRVEIYRTLIADPKDSRRKRAAKKEEKSASDAAGEVS